MKIEGKNAVREALNSSLSIKKLCIQKNAHDLQSFVDIAKKNNIRIDFLDKNMLDKLSETKHHQGVIAIADEYTYCDLDDILKLQQTKRLFVLLLDGIEDPHNLGSIIRVAECLGVDGIVIPNKRSATVNATVLRVSAGAAAHVKIAMVNNINDVIRKLKDNFVTVCCADMDGESIYTSTFTQDIAVVIGSEGFGVKHLTKNLCDKIISIPQFGKVNSLNASVACGIICSEIVRQRL